MLLSSKYYDWLGTHFGLNICVRLNMPRLQSCSFTGADAPRWAQATHCTSKQVDNLSWAQRRELVILCLSLKTAVMAEWHLLSRLNCSFDSRPDLKDHHLENAKEEIVQSSESPARWQARLHQQRLGPCANGYQGLGLGMCYGPLIQMHWLAISWVRQTC